MAARRALGNMLVERVSKKCVAAGRNYAEHARELRNSVPSVPAGDEPFFFLKPTTAYLREGRGPIQLPRNSDAQHEIELGVVIARKCRRVSVDSASSFIAGYLACVDVTARAWQHAAKERALPWSMAKGADTFLPMSRFVQPEELKRGGSGGSGGGGVADPHDLTLWLRVNGEERQRGSTRDMIWSVPQLINYASRWMTLEEGDVLLTGTPKGVGPLRDGDVLEGGIDGVVSMRFSCVEVESK